MKFSVIRDQQISNFLLMGSTVSVPYLLFPDVLVNCTITFWGCTPNLFQSTSSKVIWEFTPICLSVCFPISVSSLLGGTPPEGRLIANISR